MPTTTILLTSDGGGFDTYGYYSNAISRGSEATMEHYNQATFQPVVKFDLSSLAGKSVVSVRLRAYMDANGSGNVNVGLGQINDSYYDAFVESSAYDWNTHSPTLVTIGTIGVSYTEGWKEWSSASFPDLITAVQNWIDGAISNNGFVLTTTGGWEIGFPRYFRTKENGDGTSAAQLEVEWVTTYNETARTQTIRVVTSVSDMQSMVETGKELTMLSTQGEADIYSANETGRALTILSTQGEADIQAHIETAKLQSIAAIVTESDILTMVETGALLLMKAWIVSRFPWAFSEVDLKTATFSERRNINT